MDEIDNINHRIEQIENNLSNNYGRITPIDREKIKIELAQLKMKKIRLLQNNIINSNDPIDRIEFEKLICNYR